MSLFVFNSLNLPSMRVPRQWPPLATHVRTLYGHHVLWCPVSSGGSHFSKEELEPYRQAGDPVIDDLLERLDQEGQPLTAGGDLLELIERIECGKDDMNLSPELQRDLVAFLARYRSIPEWVDVEQAQRGREVFLTYAPAMGASLYYRSLVPGFSIPHLAAVIRSTGYLAPPASQQQVTNRLMDTGAMVSACMTGGIDTLFEGGEGWKAALYVRILHAKVRRRLLLRSGKNKWDIDQLGVPINQEDMAATLLAFSVNALKGVEFVAGMQLSRQEQFDYFALLRYIGWLLGVLTVSDENASNLRPLDPCGPGWNSNDPVNHSQSVLDSVMFHLMKPDDCSVVVANHLLTIGQSQDKDEKNENKRLAWFYFRCLQCRRFVGNPLADALQLPRHSVWWKRWLLFVASTLYLTLLRIYTLSCMLVPPIRWRLYQYHSRISTRFYDIWKESHPTRMAEALREVKGEVVVVSEASCCPYAMVAPPQHIID